MDSRYPGRVATISVNTVNGPASIHVDQSPHGFVLTSEADFLVLGQIYADPGTAIQVAASIAGYFPTTN